MQSDTVGFRIICHFHLSKDRFFRKKENEKEKKEKERERETLITMFCKFLLQ